MGGGLLSNAAQRLAVAMDDWRTSTPADEGVDEELVSACGALLREHKALRLKYDRLNQSVDEQFPRGQLNDADQGATAMGLVVVNNTAILRFPKLVSWIVLDAETARAIGIRLVAISKELSN